jgi:hypothetical protein
VAQKIWSLPRMSLKCFLRGLTASDRWNLEQLLLAPERPEYSHRNSEVGNADKRSCNGIGVPMSTFPRKSQILRAAVWSSPKICAASWAAGNFSRQTACPAIQLVVLVLVMPTKVRHALLMRTEPWMEDADYPRTLTARKVSPESRAKMPSIPISGN